MNFTSFAQNFEDIVLWRGLKHIKNGFYIDLGADDAQVNSVSMGFYQQGWRGLLIQPNKKNAEQIQQFRPNDIVLELDLTITPNNVSELPPQASSLDDLLDAAPNKVVHWLRIDFFNLKNNVLNSWSNSAVRPWVVLVNYLPTHHQELISSQFETQLIQKGYEFVFFDGVNRFYLAHEQVQLRPLFQSPPSVLDDVLISGKASTSYYGITEIRVQRAELEARQAKVKAWQAEYRAEQSLAKALASDLKATEMHHLVNGLYGSKSWKFTAPLRWLLLKKNSLRPFFLSLLKKPIFYWKKKIASKNSEVKLEQNQVQLSTRMDLSSRGELIFTNLKNKKMHQQKGTH